jgi:hypothetical protein
MLEWKVRYYQGQLPLVEATSEDYSWEDLPIDNVIQMEIKKGDCTHVIGGFDNFWMSGSHYGVFNNTGSLGEYEALQRLENGHEQVYYEGAQAIMYDWDQDHINMGEIFPDTTKVHILKGVMIPDDQAREIGLI